MVSDWRIPDFMIGGFPVETKSGIIVHKHYFKTIVFLNAVKELHANRDYEKHGDSSPATAITNAAVQNNNPGVR